MNMHNPDLEMEFVSTHNFSDRYFLKNIVDFILETPIFFRPKRFGSTEPFKNKIEPNIDPNIIVDFILENDFIGLEYARDSGFSIMPKFMNKVNLSFVCLNIPIKKCEIDSKNFKSFISIFHSFIQILNPIYASLYNASFPENNSPSDFRIRLPEIPWLSVYGQPYVDFFGKEKILTAPFSSIKELESGHFLLQASHSVYEAVPIQIRESIRKHLGEDAFMARTKWNYKNGRAPDFDNL